MIRRINEREVTFYRDGHNHDGKNSALVDIQPKQIELWHLNDNLKAMLGGGGTTTSAGGVDISPVPDLIIETPSIAAGASYTASVDWVGVCVVRFVRMICSASTDAVITFYHASTYADEDREWRAIDCQSSFLWEGAWVHYDDEVTSKIHYKVENTGANAAVFQLTLKAGTMVANADNPAIFYNRQLLGPWSQTNVPASQSAVALTINGVEGIPMIKDGSVIGVAVRSNAARTSGSLDVEVTKNGVLTGLKATLNGTYTTSSVTEQASAVTTFTAGDDIGVKVTSTSWGPTTADIAISVEINTSP